MLPSYGALVDHKLAHMEVVLESYFGIHIYLYYIQIVLAERISISVGENEIACGGRR